MRALAGNASLRHLALALTDAGVSELHDLPAFRFWQGGEATLSLVGPKSLPNRLSLRGTATDNGLRHLRGLDGLCGLGLDDQLAISADGLEPLTSLAQLILLSAPAQDDWMPHLARIPRLRFLSAQDTAATDEGFIALSQSRTIEYIWGRRCHHLRTRGFMALAGCPRCAGCR